MQTEVEQLVRELPEAGIARATRLGLVLNPGLETGTWRGLVTHVARLVRTSSGARQTLTAWLGDVLTYGETGGRGLITECAAATGHTWPAGMNSAARAPTKARLRRFS